MVSASVHVSSKSTTRLRTCPADTLSIAPSISSAQLWLWLRALWRF